METTLRATLKNKYGLHMRPSTALSRLAATFNSSVEVMTAGRPPVDGKVIMSLLSLGAVKGTDLIITARGDDADVAAKKICELIEGSFDGME